MLRNNYKLPHIYVDPFEESQTQVVPLIVKEDATKPHIQEEELNHIWLTLG